MSETSSRQSVFWFLSFSPFKCGITEKNGMGVAQKWPPNRSLFLRSSHGTGLKVIHLSIFHAAYLVQGRGELEAYPRDLQARGGGTSWTRYNRTHFGQFGNTNQPTTRVFGLSEETTRGKPLKRGENMQTPLKTGRRWDSTPKPGGARQKPHPRVQFMNKHIQH